MYPFIGSHRMAYDIDGTEVGFSDIGKYNGGILDALFPGGPKSWLTSQQKGNLNAQTKIQTWGGGQCEGMWWFFPELREVTHVGFLFPGNSNIASDSAGHEIQGSADTSNGMDGTWETPVFNFNAINNYSGDGDLWRAHILPVSFSGPMKAIRIGFSWGPINGWAGYNCIHLYGPKAAGQTPDDIVFCDSSNVELTALKDLGDTPEGMTSIYSFKVKNTSTTKIANAVNLQLNNADYGISFSADGPWSTVVDISTIAPGAVSAPIYIKYSLGPPLLTLGPRAARVITTVGSWV